MDRNMSANIAGVGGAIAMLGFSLLSRKLGFAQGDTLFQEAARTGLEATGKEGETTETQEQALGLGAQVGFGLTTAMLYSKVRRFVGLPGPVAGALFGLALWGVHAAGVAPMLGIRNAPGEQGNARAATTLISHILFGLVVGLLYDQLVHDEDEE